MLLLNRLKQGGGLLGGYSRFLGPDSREYLALVGLLRVCSTVGNMQLTIKNTTLSAVGSNI